jgi:hypothetical protein
MIQEQTKFIQQFSNMSQTQNSHGNNSQQDQHMVLKKNSASQAQSISLQSHKPSQDIHTTEVMNLRKD